MSSHLRRWLGDAGLGLALFLVLLVLGSPGHRGGSWPFDEALAGEVIATRAVEATSPAGTDAETAVVAAALLRPDGSLLQVRRISDLTVLGLTFSLLFACNLAFWRHLRRVGVASRRELWRKRT